MSKTPCIRPPRPPLSPAGWMVIIVLMLLVFVTTAHILGMSAELILLVITTVIGMSIKITKVLPELHGQPIR